MRLSSPLPVLTLVLGGLLACGCTRDGSTGRESAGDTDPAQSTDSVAPTASGTGGTSGASSDETEGSQSADESGTGGTDGPNPDGRDVVTLTLAEPAGHARSRAHVRWGVPLPQGLVGADEPLRLVDSSGTVWPTQARALSLWPDGSRRWVLLDTTATLDTDETVELTLRVPDEPEDLGNPLSVTETAETVEVDTGPLRVEIDRRSGAVLRRAWVEDTLVLDTPDGLDRGPFVQMGGTQYLGARLTPDTTPAPGDPLQQYRSWGTNNLDRPANLYDPFDLEVVVEEQGPVHAVVRVSGTHLAQDGSSTGTFIIRVHATRGQRQLRIEQTFIYTGAEGEGVQAYGFRIPVSGDDDSAEGEAGASSVAHLQWDTHTLDGQSQAGAAQGIVSRSNGTTGQAVLLRDMSERFPKALELDAEGIEVQLYPHAAPPWSLERYSNTIDTGNGETGEPRDRGAQGLSVTDTWIWAPFEGSADPDALAAAAAALDAGLLTLTPPPGWTSDARVLGLGAFQIPLDTGADAHVRADAVLRVAADFMRVNQRREFGWFGLEDYGDVRGQFDGGDASFTWSELGRYGWSGNSGEPSNQLWTQYLRTPSRALLLDAEALARHTQDQTMVHYGDASSIDDTAWNGRNREFSVGSQHRHGRQAWSGYAGLPEYSHIAGVETWYYLSGDARARETLYEAAEFITRYGPDTLEWTAHANGIDVLSRAASVFHDDPELEARYLARNDQLLDWIDTNDSAYMREEFAGLADVGNNFNVFVRVLPGLMYEHERSGDPRALQAITIAADQLADPDDPMGLTNRGSEGSVYYHMAPLAYLASSEGPGSPYYERAVRVLGLNCHHVDADDTGAISDTSIAAIPADWRDWSWQWDEDPLDPRSPGILWIHRQLFWRNDFMQDYHSYRAFTHLAAVAAAVEPADATCMSR
ncbi:MAG: hypothetical protein KUG77_11080 [Nannocystaceae bacterium]|nr:hypothetical protein [Nannocystaceae bacterium]